jgi:hypothetical protein
MRLPLALPSVVLALASGACAADPAEALDHIRACGVDPGETAYYGYLTGLDESSCAAGCVEGAPCTELQPLTMLEQEELGGCPPPDATGQCVTSCLGGCYTPLVLSFDRAPVRFAHTEGRFDFGAGAPQATDWPSAETPWLVLDRNGNGVVDDATELFGDATPLLQGGRGANGFVPLAELDANRDRRLTAADDAWSRLLLWSDRNVDRVSSPDELTPLAETSVVAIDRAYARVPRCDARGNCEASGPPSSTGIPRAWSGRAPWSMSISTGMPRPPPRGHGRRSRDGRLRPAPEHDARAQLGAGGEQFLEHRGRDTIRSRVQRSTQRRRDAETRSEEKRTRRHRPGDALTW